MEDPLTCVGTDSLKAGASTFPRPAQICHSIELIIDLTFPIDTKMITFHSHEDLTRENAQERGFSGSICSGQQNLGVGFDDAREADDVGFVIRFVGKS